VLGRLLLLCCSTRLLSQSLHVGEGGGGGGGGGYLIGYLFILTVTVLMFIILHLPLCALWVLWGFGTGMTSMASEAVLLVWNSCSSFCTFTDKPLFCRHSEESECRSHPCINIVQTTCTCVCVVVVVVLVVFVCVMCVIFLCLSLCDPQTTPGCILSLFIALSISAS